MTVVIPYIVLLVISAIALVGLAIFTIQTKPPTGRPLAVFLFGSAFWSLTHVGELLSFNDTSKTIAVDVMYVAIALTIMSWLAFALAYTGNGRWLTRGRIAALSTPFVVMLLVIWTNPYHHLYFEALGVAPDGPFPSATYVVYGPLLEFNVAYIYILLIAGIAVLIRALVRSPQMYRGQIASLLLGSLAPALFGLLQVSGVHPRYVDITPIGFVVTGLLFGHVVLSRRLFNVVPIARDSVIETLADGMIVLDTANCIVDLNPMAEKIIGQKAREVIGLPIREVISGKLDVFERDADVTQARDEIEATMEEEQLTFKLRIDPIHSRQEELVGHLIILSEITDQKQAEEALRRRMSQLALLNEITRIATATLNLSELLQSLADSAAEIVGGDGCYITLWDDENRRAIPAAAYGQLRETYGQRTHDSNERTLTESLLEAGHPLAIDDVFNTPYMSRSIAERYPAKSILGLPLQADGRYLGALLLAFNEPYHFTEDDIEWATQVAELLALAIAKSQAYAGLEERVRERTAELEIAYRQLQELDRLKSEFVANISHELRTPITSINLFHYMLPLRPDKQESYLASLRREVARLGHVVETLLFVARQTHGQEVPVLESVDINALIELYVADRVTLAEQRGLTLTFKAEDGLPVIQADPRLVERTLSILVDNAFNYTPSGGRIEISTHSRQKDAIRWVGFKVSDTGAGIPVDEQSRLFERFFRGKITLDTGTSGTGLGLATAKAIVEQHRGKIEAESEGLPGKGAVFTVWLPVDA